MSLRHGVYFIELRDAGLDAHSNSEIEQQLMCPAGYEVDISLAPYTGAGPVCDANGPYNAVCSGPTTSILLDGTGSFDPHGDPLTYGWTTDCPGGTFDDPGSATPVLTVDSIAPCPLTCNVELTVTDSCGLWNTCSATVTVSDTIPPQLSLPNDTTVECDNTSPAGAGWATATDQCDAAPDVTYSDQITPGRCDQEYVITRTWTATDDCNNATSDDQIITVVDTTPPVIAVDTTPITVVDVDCSGDEEVDIPASVTDNCDPNPVLTDDAPATFPAGQTTTVTFTASDDCGNTTTEQVDVTVKYGANIEVTALRFVTGSTGGPPVTKAPLVGILVGAYDNSPGSCAAGQVEQNAGALKPALAGINDNCTPINTGTTDLDGKTVIDVPPGDYVVATPYFDLQDPIVPDHYLGGFVDELECTEWETIRLHTNIYGDTDHNGAVNVFDVFCILDGFAGDFSVCSFEDNDIHPCVPNGVLNLFDVFAALDAIAGIDPCTESAPAPASPPGRSLSRARVAEAPEAGLSIVPSRKTVRAGKFVSVDVFVSGVTDLRGYQVAIETIDGPRGYLALESITVDRARRDYVFGGHESVDASDEAGWRVMAALLDGGVSSASDAYLATYTFRVSRTARGVFRIIVRPDDVILLNSAGQESGIRSVSSATISVR